MFNQFGGISGAAYTRCLPFESTPAFPYGDNQAATPRCHKKGDENNENIISVGGIFRRSLTRAGW